mmetsp:Transcript_75119/g.132764  ORF Transcript_75119/g.132764 Transcript_75119/m.132764 type:complete len:456 (+) Transcript_75119:150-1517(+)
MSQFAKHNCRTDTSFACPVVGRREMMKQQAAHRDRLQNMKSALDTRAPAAQPHLTLYGRDYVAKKRATTEAAFADLKMIQAIARTMTREHKIDERKGPVSLIGTGRKQEIYRIMSENHRLLDSIENCEPMMRTAEMVKQDKFRKRYIINASHTSRLSGEYDDEIQRIKTEEKSKLDEYKRSAQIRLASSQRLKASGTVSLPSLSPNGQRGAETPPSAQPKAGGRGKGGASSSGYKGAGRGDGPSPPPATPPPQPPKAEEPQESNEAEEAMAKSAPPPQEAEPSSSSRQPVRFEVDEGESSEAGGTMVNRTKTPHAGGVDLSNFPEEDAGEPAVEEKAEADVATALQDHVDEVAVEGKAEAEVATALHDHVDEVAAPPAAPAVGIPVEAVASEAAAADSEEQSFTNAATAQDGKGELEKELEEAEEQSYEETFEAEEETFEDATGNTSKSESSPPA